MAIRPAGSPFAGHVEHGVHVHAHIDKRTRETEEISDNTPKAHEPSNILPKALEVEALRKSLVYSQEKPLWVALDEGRQVMHARAVQNHFLMSLFKGGFCQSAFMKYLVNLLPIHEALEEAQKRLLTHAHLRVFVMPELFRSEGIKRDLKIWEAVADPRFVPWLPCKMAIEYAERIKELSIEDPAKVAGVMYALYGTVMSGGQTNKIRIADFLEAIRGDGVPPGSGVAFYELRQGDELLDAPGVAQFKQSWHVNLCRVQELLPSDRRKDLEGFQEVLKAEVVKAFETIIRIVETDVEPHHC